MTRSYKFNNRVYAFGLRWSNDVVGGKVDRAARAGARAAGVRAVAIRTTPAQYGVPDPGYADRSRFRAPVYSAAATVAEQVKGSNMLACWKLRDDRYWIFSSGRQGILPSPPGDAIYETEAEAFDAFNKILGNGGPSAFQRFHAPNGWHPSATQRGMDEYFRAKPQIKLVTPPSVLKGQSIPIGFTLVMVGYVLWEQVLSDMLFPPAVQGPAAQAPTIEVSGPDFHLVADRCISSTYSTLSLDLMPGHRPVKIACTDSGLTASFLEPTAARQFGPDLRPAGASIDATNIVQVPVPASPFDRRKIVAFPKMAKVLTQLNHAALTCKAVKVTITPQPPADIQENQPFNRVQWSLTGTTPPDFCLDELSEIPSTVLGSMTYQPPERTWTIEASTYASR